MKPVKWMAKTALATALVGLAACTTPIENTANNGKGQAQMAASLQTHVWTLTQVEGGAKPLPPAALSKVQLNFVDERGLMVQGLCNSMRGHYSAQGQALEIGRLASTMMACPDDQLMAAERQVGALLPQAQTWQLQDKAAAPELEIGFADGQRWLLQGQVKPETLYGAPERVFLEIAPQLQACTHPLMPNAQCLQVRSVAYDANGLKKSQGEWENFHGAIEGFEHRTGVRNIVRLKRFTNPYPPADASRYVYVLDMVVETSVEK